MAVQVVKFSVVLFLVLGLGYFLHTGFFVDADQKELLDLINFSYKFNILFTYLFTTTIILLSKHLKNQIGFFFLGGGFVKITVFIYLIKSMGFDTGREVFLHFFLPYVTCVVVEIVFISRILNRSNFQKDN